MGIVVALEKEARVGTCGNKVFALERLVRRSMSYKIPNGEDSM